MRDEFALRRKAMKEVWVWRAGRKVKQPRLETGIRAIERYNARHLDIDEVAAEYARLQPDTHAEIVPGGYAPEGRLIDALDFKLVTPRLPKRKAESAMLYLAGFSQVEIAARYQVDQKTISRWLRDVWVAVGENKMPKMYCLNCMDK